MLYVTAHRSAMWELALQKNSVIIIIIIIYDSVYQRRTDSGSGGWDTYLGEGALGPEQAVDGDDRHTEHGGEREAPADDVRPRRVHVVVVRERLVHDEAEYHNALEISKLKSY